ncbi:MAG: MlaD family protein [Burkholderiales bacterium]|nr:MlaD family protein [Burkholderiales bacterium]
MTKIPDDLPQAVVAAKRRRPQLIWIIPAIAALIGAWLAVDAVRDMSRTVTIRFQSAEGLEAGTTLIRFKDVTIGEVKTIALAPDRSHVLVTARLDQSAELLMMQDTRFWVVRPRFSGGQLSGVGTLFSGAYIAVGAGQSKIRQREFVGLEVAPILTEGLPGRQFLLHATELGSLDVGSPVYFRQIKVGEVTAYDLNKSGVGIDLKIFVHAPYDRFVGSFSRFWNASGVDITLDANGVRLQTQSLTSILIGGIAFETPPNVLIDNPAEANQKFTLHRDHATALKTPDGEPELFVLHFKESLRGLAPGAPVDFRGIIVGEVKSVGVEYDPAREWFDFPVQIMLYPKRIRLAVRDGKQHADAAERIKRGLLKAMVERGFRAQLRTGNLLTGQLYIALDFFKEAKKVSLNSKQQPMELPTVPGNFEELQVALATVIKNLSKVQFEQIGTDLQTVMKSLNVTLKSVDQLSQRLDNETAPEIRATLEELRHTLTGVERVLASDSPLQLDVRETMREISRAAVSLRSLADTLDRQPEALLSGKKEQ